MSITDTTPRVLYTGNGSTVTFAIPFEFVSNSEVDVYLRDTLTGTQTLQTEGSAYSISGTNVVYLSAPLSTDKILVIRSTAKSQANEYEENVQFLANSAEAALDKLTAIAQELSERLDRAPVLSATNNLDPLVLPDPEAGSAIGWNNDEDGLTNIAGGFAGSVTVSAFGATLVDDVDGAAALATLGIAPASDAGDLIVFNGSSYSKLSAGPNGSSIVANSSLSNGLGWVPLGNAQVLNLGFKIETTTNAGDTLTMCGAAGGALSQSNPAFVRMPDVGTAGLWVTFKVVANISQVFTGAHWGLGTFGNQTNYMISFYLINDASILKLGFSAINGHHVILNADDTATQASVITTEKVLVNSALGTDAIAVEMGYVTANFNDTGDIWAIQDVKLYPRPPIPQIYVPTTQGFGTLASGTFRWFRTGMIIKCAGLFTCGTTAASEARIGLPSGLVTGASGFLPSISHAGGFATNANAAKMFVMLADPAVAFFNMGSHAAGAAGLSKQNGSGIFGNGEIGSFSAEAPVAGWN